MRSVIRRLLVNIGSRKEIDSYLKRFGDVEAVKFAIVKVGGGTLRDELESLATSLTFLSQVGLTPIVVHGSGPQVDEALERAGIQTDKRDGLRVTTPEVLNVARRVFIQQNLRLVEALRKCGARAESVTSGVFEAELLDKDSYGMVGKVSAVHLEQLRHALRDKTVPVISPLGETRDGQILNINADVATNELVRVIEPFKVVFLTATGGILNDDGEIISSINLTTDYEKLMGEPWLHSGMRLKLEQINLLLRDLPRSSSVSITRPALLAKELFTHRGSGTLVRVGERIETHRSWEEVDTDRVRKLFYWSFRKDLADDYFASTELAALYVAENYLAAAVIVADEPVARLDKFAVTEEAQGEGLGRAVWARVREAHQSLCWRARPDNPVNEFYFRQADGCIKTEEWNVYWYGLKEFDAIENCVQRVLGAEVTLS